MIALISVFLFMFDVYFVSRGCLCLCIFFLCIDLSSLFKTFFLCKLDGRSVHFKPVRHVCVVCMIVIYTSGSLLYNRL